MTDTVPEQKTGSRVIDAEERFAKARVVEAVYDQEQDRRVLEGVIVEKTDLPEDPQGDADWIPAWVKTSRGISDRSRYLARQSRRAARRWVARQRSVHGILPRAGRGTRRTHEWVRGTKGAVALAAADTVKLKARHSRHATNAARWALLDRKAKAKAADVAAEELNKAKRELLAAEKEARRGQWVRGSVVYGPVSGLLTAGVVIDGWLGLAASGVITLMAATVPGRRLNSEDIDFEERAASLVLDPGMTPTSFAKMLREALEEDLNVKVADLHVLAHAWGFEARVQLHKAKPSDVTSKLDDLEASLVARPGSILIQQSAKARPLFTLRALGSDPWAGQQPIPYRAPKSVSVHDKADLGIELTQSPLRIPFLRTNAVLVGGPGSGKSNALLAIAEYLTACRDAVVWDIDLGSAGAGLDPISDAIARRATNAKDARILLEDALALSVTRPRLFKKLGMGRNWEPSPEHPALVLIIDEYPALVAAGLFDIVAEIIRTGRKSAVNVVMAAQGATKSFLGSADPAAVQTRIALPCRPQDVTQLFDGGALGEGWAAHKLRPSEGKTLNDVSVAYVRGGDYVEPIPKRFNYLDDESFEARGRERRQAGLVELDEASLETAGVDLSVQLSGAVDTFSASADDADRIAEAEAHIVLPAILDAAIEIMQDIDDPAMTPGDLLEALREKDASEFGTLSSVTLGRELSALEAPARSWGKQRGVFLVDLLAAAGAYRKKVASGR